MSTKNQEKKINQLYLDMSLLSIQKEWLHQNRDENNNQLIYLFGPNACYLFFARGLCLLGK